MRYLLKHFSDIGSLCEIREILSLKHVIYVDYFLMFLEGCFSIIPKICNVGIYVVLFRLQFICLGVHCISPTRYHAKDRGIK